jgi:hypothetical protein
MDQNKFSQYWAEAQFCYTRAEVAKNPASKGLWIELAQDWVALSENLVPQSDQQHYIRRKQQLAPFLAA